MTVAECDVLIAGGGLVGLSLAMAMSGSGLRVLSTTTALCWGFSPYFSGREVGLMATFRDGAFRDGPGGGGTLRAGMIGRSPGRGDGHVRLGRPRPAPVRVRRAVGLAFGASADYTSGRST